MKRIETILYGIYPKSEKLRIRIGRWERHILSTPDLVDNLRQETDNVENEWSESGIEHWASPLFNWYDIFRPLSSLIRGIELGPLTRYHETNTFYRIPVVGNDLSVNEAVSNNGETKDGLPLPLYYGNSEWSFLPGLMTFYAMSETAGMKQEEFTEKMVPIYRDILKLTGKKKLFVFESSDPGQFDYSIYKEVMEPSKTVIFFSKPPVKDNLSSISGKFYSLIESSENPHDLSLHYSQLRGVSVIDAHSTSVENRQKILEQVEDIGEDTILTSNDYLDFLPRVIADKKVRVLGGCSNVR